jgi:LytS/YehU family sensor histidine kinase
MHLNPVDVPLYLLQRLVETEIVHGCILLCEIRLRLLVVLHRVEGAECHLPVADDQQKVRVTGVRTYNNEVLDRHRCTLCELKGVLSVACIVTKDKLRTSST